jgi:hypothetical protein
MYGYIGRNYELEKWFKFNNHISTILDSYEHISRKKYMMINNELGGRLLLSALVARIIFNTSALIAGLRVARLKFLTSIPCLVRQHYANPKSVKHTNSARPKFPKNKKWRTQNKKQRETIAKNPDDQSIRTLSFSDCSKIKTIATSSLLFSKQRPRNQVNLKRELHGRRATRPSSTTSPICGCTTTMMSEQAATPRDYQEG